MKKKNELLSNCRKYDVDLISLIAPTSDDRIQMIAREGMGVYFMLFLHWELQVSAVI